MDKQAIEREIEEAKKRAEEAGSTWETPKWILSFLDAPYKAVSAALSHQYYFDNLNPLDLWEILVEWARMLGPEFRKVLNEQVRHWIHMKHFRDAIMVLNWVGPDGTCESQKGKQWWLDYRTNNILIGDLPELPNV